MLSGIAIIPIALWELSLGFWLTFKGFNPSAPILSTPAAAWGSEDASAAAVAPHNAVAAKAAAV